MTKKTVCPVCKKILSSSEIDFQECENCDWTGDEDQDFDPLDSLDDDDEWLKDQEIREEYGKGDE